MAENQNGNKLKQFCLGTTEQQDKRIISHKRTILTFLSFSLILVIFHSYFSDYFLKTLKINNKYINIFSHEENIKLKSIKISFCNIHNTYAQVLPLILLHSPYLSISLRVVSLPVWFQVYWMSFTSNSWLTSHPCYLWNPSYLWDYLGVILW